jgi:GT2 family glycosyltransferase
VTRVLIGVPTLNGPDRLDRALASVKAHTDLADVTVLVSDDCSTPANLQLNKDVVHKHGVEMLMTEERLGVSMQWNRLVRHVPDAEICVLVNDDVEVVEDWLDVLVFSLERNPDLGMVALRCETGVIKKDCPPRPMIDYNEARLMAGGGTLVSSGGACFAFRRGDWESVKGFDERYFCFYEEVDFGVTLATELGRFSAFALPSSTTWAVRRRRSTPTSTTCW